MNALRVRETAYEGKIHPLQFALWAGMASIVMMFVALTSAYIVRQAQGNWLEFRLPTLFFVSTLIILLSSVGLQFSYISFKKGNESRYKSLLWITFLLGIAFVVLQYQAWMDLVSVGIELTGNPSGSFVYIISGVHLAHIVGGLAVLLTAIMHTRLPFKVTQRRLVRFEMTLTYWHFVGALWLYIIVFFVIMS